MGEEAEDQRSRREKKDPNPYGPMEHPVISLVADSHFTGVRIFNPAAVLHITRVFQSARDGVNSPTIARLIATLGFGRAPFTPAQKIDCRTQLQQRIGGGFDAIYPRNGIEDDVLLLRRGVF
jgi:hypothetical protein